MINNKEQKVSKNEVALNSNMNFEFQEQDHEQLSGQWSMDDG